MNPDDTLAISDLFNTDFEWLNPHEKYITERIAAIALIEKQIESSASTPQSHLKLSLIRLAHPSVVEDLLVALDKYQTSEDISELISSGTIGLMHYQDQTNMVDEMDRLLRSMVSLDDNGENYLTNRAPTPDLNPIELIQAIAAELATELSRERTEAENSLFYSGRLSRCVMFDIHWSFFNETMHSRSHFDDEVFRSHLTAHNAGSWDPERVAILGQKIRIEDPSCSRQFQSCVQLSADNGAWFSHGELLFKLHNLMVGICPKLGDRTYFDGLALVEQDGISPPMYRVNLGG